MKRIIITLLVLLPLFVSAQEFDVAQFSLLEFDLTAINEATKFVDDNGEDCALIKIETTEKGFFFDGGSIGIAKIEDNHKGEIWVYVPAGLRKISIMHDKFGVIRNYYFPITLVSARTYLMKLKTPGQKADDKTEQLQKEIDDLKKELVNYKDNQQSSSNASHNIVSAGECFSIQVFNENNGSKSRAKAYEINSNIVNNSKFDVFIEYAAPFWIVRIGNCLTREDANELLEKIIEVFPDYSNNLRIVPIKTQ